MDSRKTLFAAAALLAACASFANPIVWIHGWNSSGSLWKEFQAQMRESANADARDFLTLSYYDSGSGFDFNTDTPIEEVSAAVARAIVNFYEDRGDGKPLDVVAHSMGGLVFRSLVAQECLVDNSILRRYVTLGTPHYGQDAEVSFQAKQMKYGSSFLWHLGEAWHFDGRRWPGKDTLCIAGMSDLMIGSSTPHGSYWDGLIHAWSASLGGDVPVRYVYRCHSSVMFYAKASALCTCKDKDKDAVFCLVRQFLDDGSVPAELTPTFGGSSDNATGLPRWVDAERAMWSLFAQVHSASNCVPMSYVSGDIEAYYVVDGAKPDDHSVEYGASGSYGYGEGVFQVFGNLPTGGVHGVAIWKPGKTTAFVAPQTIVPEPGSCRLMRIYDSPDPTIVASAAGQPVAVPLSWLAATGLVANVECLSDCSNKVAATVANGYTGAECWYYGVNPWDADDRAWISPTGLSMSDGAVGIAYSPADAAAVRVHVQRTATLGEPFSDVADGELARDEGSVRVPVGKSDTSGFYRLFVR